MQVFKKKSPSYFHSFIHKIFKSNAYLKFIILLSITIVILFSLIASFIGGVVLYKTEYITSTLSPKLLEILSGAKKIYYQAFYNPPPQIEIHIDFVNLQKLAYKRKKALELGKLISEADDFVSARLLINGKFTNVKLRLKGDNLDHLFGEKWSFRIHTKNDETVFGMRRFSLQQPETRNYLNEYFFHKILEDQGILNLKYKFVNVSLNGKDLGIYALEEHFSKELLERQRRREGPIIKLNEEKFWDNLVAGIGQNNISGSYYNSFIDAFSFNKILNSSAQKAQFNRAAFLLEQFRHGKLKASDVFEVDKYASYLALIDLLGAKHALAWVNFRFYFNPVTSKLEPIGYDADAGLETGLLLIAQQEVFKNFLKLLFRDNNLKRLYVSYLDKFSRKEFLDTIFTKYKKDFDQQKIYLNHEIHLHPVFSEKVFYNNQKYIRSILNQGHPLNAFFTSINQSGKSTVINFDIKNRIELPIEILGAQYDTVHFDIAGPDLIIPEVQHYQIPEIYSAKFINSNISVPENPDINKFQIIYRVLGLDDIKKDSVNIWHKQDIHSDNITEITPENYTNFTFLTFDKNNNNFIIKPGAWKISRALFFNNKYSLVCLPGTTLDFVNSGSIICNTNIYFNGTEQNIIQLNSSDSTGQGLLVYDSKKESLLNHVTVNNMACLNFNGWILTGGITFYRNPFEIKNSNFLNSRSEDALNIIDSSFKIDNIFIFNTFSDGLDIDFGNGAIKNSVFTRTKNDCLDFSGSSIQLDNITCKFAGDKAISVGEKSHLYVNNCRVLSSKTGMAAKDLSSLKITASLIKDCKVGLAAYQKKQEFGPAAITASNLQMINNTNLHFIEKNSRLNLNNSIIPGTMDRVMEKIETIQ